MKLAPFRRLLPFLLSGVGSCSVAPEAPADSAASLRGRQLQPSGTGKYNPATDHLEGTHVARPSLLFVIRSVPPQA